MTNQTEISRDLLETERAEALRQARGQVAIQVFLLTACLVIWAVSGFAQQLGWLVGIGILAAVATVYDIRWWQWLRHAAPMDAYLRLQRREEFEGFVHRTHLTLFTTPVAFAVWWWLGR
jgi:hypothetical protein